MRFNVGDSIYVPWAYDMTFNPTMTVVEEIIGDKYICEVSTNNLAAREIERVHASFREHESFALDELDKIKTYIHNYYYAGYCDNCKYDKITGSIWRCRNCEHAERVKAEDIMKYDKYVCKRTGLCVGSTFQLSSSMEICKHFVPIREVDKKDYVSWEFYDDTLRNCIYNPNCATHTKSAHKTCPYERYMNQNIQKCFTAKFNMPEYIEGEHVTYSVLVKRTDWLENNYENGLIKCLGVVLEPDYTEKGRMKKGTANRYIWFNAPKYINIKTGEFSDAE